MSVLTNLEQNVSVVDTLFSSLAVGDLETFARLFSPNVVWHQPGNNKFSGDKPNFGAIGEMVNGMMSDSQGSFYVKPIGKAMANNDLVSVPVQFGGRKDINGVQHEYEMPGHDLFRLKEGKIVEVWLFSSDQEGEDRFWGK